MHAFAQLCIAAAGALSLAQALRPQKAQRACALEREELAKLPWHPEAEHYARRALTESRAMSFTRAIGSLGAPGAALCVGLCYLSPSAQQALGAAATIAQFFGGALAAGGSLFYAHGFISLSPGQHCAKFPPRRPVSGEVEQAFKRAQARGLSERERSALSQACAPSSRATAPRSRSRL